MALNSMMDMLILNIIYFERKFDFTRSQLKDAIIRLDNANLAARSFRTIVVNGRNFPNELHLKINLPKLLQLKTKYIACLDDDLDDSISSNSTDEDVFSAKVRGNSVSAFVENTSEHISIKEISLIKTRSKSASSFFRKSFKESAVEQLDLASFYPLSQPDIALLQQNSGRDFTPIAVNEILLKLSKKI